MIYQPEYEPLKLGNLSRRGVPTLNELGIALEYGLTAKLRRLKKEEMRKYIDSGLEGAILNVPLNRIPKLIGAVNTQRQLTGIDPYTIESP